MGINPEPPEVMQKEFSAEDQRWMQRALDQAELAAEVGEVPVGAVLVREGVLIAEAGNAPIINHDPTAHAEIRVLRLGAEKLSNYRVPGTTLYVTLEPCPMCAGAMIHARVERLVFAASDPRTGAAGSVFSLLQDQSHNHQVQVESGLMAQESADMLRHFFRARRKKAKSEEALPNENIP